MRMVIVARPAAAELSYQQSYDAIGKLFRKEGVLRD